MSGPMSTPDEQAGPGHDVNAEIAALPLPTPTELRRRSSLWRQALRFVVLNVKIFRLTRQHH